MTMESENTTIASLQKRLEEKDAELQRLRIELDRVNQELTNEVAERRRIEQALRKTEERFRLLFEQTHDVVYAVTPDGMITYLNRPFVRYGYSPDEVISRNFIEFVAPEQREPVTRKARSYARTLRQSPEGACVSQPCVCGVAGTYYLLPPRKTRPACIAPIRSGYNRAT